MSPELGEGKRREISPDGRDDRGGVASRIPLSCHTELPPTVIPNAERDLIVMAVERQGERERCECRVLSNEC
jgi:hypothetical protein